MYLHQILTVYLTLNADLELKQGYEYKMSFSAFTKSKRNNEKQANTVNSDLICFISKNLSLQSIFFLPDEGD